MPVLTEGRHTGEFILTESNGKRSRDNVTVAFTAAGKLAAGTVMGKITLTDKWKPHEDGASDGSETAAGILYDNVAAEAASDVVAVMITRDMEAKRGALEWDASVNTTAKEDAAITELAAFGIVIREGE
ncbi:MAG: head decoration protein [Sneathiella sp.]|nr:MAG: head decoration protein [Sneathiella sp.]